MYPYQVAQGQQDPYGSQPSYTQPQAPSPPPMPGTPSYQPTSAPSFSSGGMLRPQFGGQNPFGGQQQMGHMSGIVAPSHYNADGSSTPDYGAMQRAHQSGVRYSHGGHVPKTHKTGAMIDVHLGLPELEIMDHLQGKKMMDRRSGQRIYPHIEELIKNPHLRESIHGHFKQHLATGGHVDQEQAPHLMQMHAEGEHPMERVKIGPHTHNMLHYMAGGNCSHHMDGHPQYFAAGGFLKSLGSALGGAWGGIKNAGSAALDKLKQFGGNALQGAKESLPGIGRTVGGQLLGHGANILANKVGGTGGDVLRLLGGVGGAALQGNQQLTPMQQAISNGLTKTGMGVMSGQNVGKAVGSGIAEGAGSHGDSAAHSAVQRLGQGIESGENFGKTLGQAGMTGLNTGAQQMFGAQNAEQGVVPALSHVLGGAGTEGGMMGRAKEIGQGIVGRLPQYQAPLPEDMQYGTA